MTELAEKIRQELAKIKDPLTNVPVIFLGADIDIKVQPGGNVYIVYFAKDPYSSNVITYVEAVKKIASKVAGDRKILVEVRNHMLSDLLNIRFNE